MSRTIEEFEFPEPLKVNAFLKVYMQPAVVALAEKIENDLFDLFDGKVVGQEGLSLEIDNAGLIPEVVGQTAATRRVGYCIARSVDDFFDEITQFEGGIAIYDTWDEADSELRRYVHPEGYNIYSVTAQVVQPRLGIAR